MDVAVLSAREATKLLDRDLELHSVAVILCTGKQAGVYTVQEDHVHHT